jgi:predicted nucleotidyltransferase
MDFSEIKLKVINFDHELRRRNIHPDIILLFGSYAKGTATKHSDVDLAVVSRDFGKNRIKEGIILNKILFKLFPEAEAIPIGLKDFLDKENVSPILSELKKTGIAIL